MSFAKDAKLEVLEHEIVAEECGIAFLSGLFRSAGELGRENGRYNASIITDVRELFDSVNKIVDKLYGGELKIEIADGFVINKTTYYKLVFPPDAAERILEDAGVIVKENGEYSFVFGIDPNLIAEDDAKRAFIKGAFLGACTSSIKISEDIMIKTSSGYHLEFTSHSHEFLSELSSMLAEYSVLAKLIKRKNQYVLYIKEASSVENLLALVEASGSVVRLMEEMVVRQMRNRANREANCVSANISKTVNASLLQVESIEYIMDTIGLEELPEDLQDVAMLRLANQEESLTELLSLSTEDYTKSGLNHRLGRLVNIAKKLGKIDE